MLRFRKIFLVTVVCSSSTVFSIGFLASIFVYRFPGPIDENSKIPDGFSFVEGTASLVRKGADKDAPFILFFHGSEGNCLNYYDRIEALVQENPRAGVLLYEYKTVENREISSKASFASDGAQAWDLALQYAEPKDIVIYGRSMGGAGAIAALKHAVKSGDVPRGVIIDGGFDSLLEVIGASISFLKYLFINHDLNLAEDIKAIKKDSAHVPSLKIAQIVLTNDVVVHPERQLRLASVLQNFVGENYQKIEIAMDHMPKDDEQKKMWNHAKKDAWSFVLQ